MTPSKFFILILFALASLLQAASLRHKKGNKQPNTKSMSTDCLYKKWETLQFEDDENNSSKNVKKDDLVPAEGIMKRISYNQFMLSWGVSVPIYMIFLYSNDESSVMKEIILAANTYSIFLCLPGHFGYFPTFEPNTLPDDISLRIFKLRKIVFPATNFTVSYRRWLAVPWFWLSEILMLIPWNLPERSYFQLFIECAFAYCALHVFGIWEILDRIMTYIFEKFAPPSQEAPLELF